MTNELEDSERLVLCEACGSEGHIYSGHPNDPQPRYKGPCPVCGGKGDMVIKTEPIEANDLPPPQPSLEAGSGELVKRLEKHASRGGDRNDGYECCNAPWTCCPPDLLTEAASRLQSLERQLEEANAEIAALTKERNNAYARCKALEGPRADGVAPSQADIDFDEFARREPWWPVTSGGKAPPHINISLEERDEILVLHRQLEEAKAENEHLRKLWHPRFLENVQLAEEEFRELQSQLSATQEKLAEANDRANTAEALLHFSGNQVADMAQYASRTEADLRKKLAGSIAAEGAAHEIIAELREKLEAAEKERRRFDIALQSLTPGGSEYVNDPDRCVAIVRDMRKSQHKWIVEKSHENEELRASLATKTRELEAVRGALENAPRLADGDLVAYWDWFFKVRVAALSRQTEVEQEGENKP